MTLSHLPTAFLVMATAMLLGGFVAPLFAFLFAAFLGSAIEARLQDRRRIVQIPALVRHRSF